MREVAKARAGAYGVKPKETLMMVTRVRQVIPAPRRVQRAQKLTTTCATMEHRHVRTSRRETRRERERGSVCV